MSILMSAEWLVFIIGIAAVVITVVVTLYLTHKNTQEILREQEEILKGQENPCASGKIRDNTKVCYYKPKKREG